MEVPLCTFASLVHCTTATNCCLPLQPAPCPAPAVTFQHPALAPSLGACERLVGMLCAACPPPPALTLPPSPPPPQAILLAVISATAGCAVGCFALHVLRQYLAAPRYKPVPTIAPASARSIEDMLRDSEQLEEGAHGRGGGGGAHQQPPWKHSD